MIAVLLAALLSVPALAGPNQLFLHVNLQRVGGESTVLSLPWSRLEDQDMEDDIGPLILPLRSALDQAAGRMADAEAGESTVLRHRSAGVSLVARLEQRPDAGALFEELLAEVQAGTAALR